MSDLPIYERGLDLCCVTVIRNYTGPEIPGEAETRCPNDGRRLILVEARDMPEGCIWEWINARRPTGPRMFGAIILTRVFNDREYRRVAITSNQKNLCSEENIVCYIKQRSRYESIELTLERAEALASILNRGI